MLTSFGFEVLVQPALYLAGAITVLVVLFKGSARPVIEEDGATRKGRRVLASGSKKRALLTLAAAAVLLPALVITPPGHRAAIYNLGGGVSPTERQEGLSLVIPWVQSARMVSVRTQLYDVEVYPQTKDLQEVTVPVGVNYHVAPGQAAELYQAQGLDYQLKVIVPAVGQLVTQEVGQYLAIDFAQNRAQLAASVHTALVDRLEPYGIIVESVNVKDAIFDPNFITAVRDKIIADEEASEQRRLVEAERAKKAQAILQAEARAESAKIEGAGQRAAIEEVAASLGFTPAEYLEYLRLNRWDGVLPKTVVGGESESLIFDVGAGE